MKRSHELGNESFVYKRFNYGMNQEGAQSVETERGNGLSVYETFNYGMNQGAQSVETARGYELSIYKRFIHRMNQGGGQSYETERGTELSVYERFNYGMNQGAQSHETEFGNESSVYERFNHGMNQGGGQSHVTEFGNELSLYKISNQAQSVETGRFWYMSSGPADDQKYYNMMRPLFQKPKPKLDPSHYAEIFECYVEQAGKEVPKLDDSNKPGSEKIKQIDANALIKFLGKEATAVIIYYVERSSLRIIIGNEFRFQIGNRVVLLADHPFTREKLLKMLAPYTNRISFLGDNQKKWKRMFFDAIMKKFTRSRLQVEDLGVHDVFITPVFKKLMATGVVIDAHIRHPTVLHYFPRLHYGTLRLPRNENTLLTLQSTWCTFDKVEIIS
uniref:Uncharacterized protein n=1 Tax=Panagrolaimus sp. JU765 TaxID=591449 RepID=A0AC34QK42_9BILA